jgi:hypothetical protein
VHPLRGEEARHRPARGPRGEAAAGELRAQPVAYLGVPVLAVDVPADDPARQGAPDPDTAVEAVLGRKLALEPPIMASTSASVRTDADQRSQWPRCARFATMSACASAESPASSGVGSMSFTRRSSGKEASPIGVARMVTVVTVDHGR